jgi:ketosteroid isomerase-like protein
MRRRAFACMGTVLLVGSIVALAPKSFAQKKKPVPAEVSEVGAKFGSAVNGKDAAKAAALYGTDAQLMAPNAEIIRGRANIEAFWKKLIEQDLKVSTTTIEADVSGSIGYETGTYDLSFRSADGQVIHDQGKYVNLMKRGGDGHWYMTIDIWNSSLPAAPAK